MERGTGVTIVYGGQVFLTQPPVEADRKLIGEVIFQSQQHEKQGRPCGQQTPRPK